MTAPPAAEPAGPQTLPPARAEGPAARVAGVSKSYPATRRAGPSPLPALDDVSLDVTLGERLALLGPNGSGKSTLLKILSTSLRPDRGSVVALGHELYASPAATRAVRARLGVVFQHPGLDPLLTVNENLRTHTALYGLPGPRAAERTAWAARRLDIEPRLHDRVGTLSGGLVRRVDLARALLHDPDLLLLDEPSTGLDLRARREFLATLDAIAASPRPGGPLTVVVSTHLMDEAERCTRVAMLRRGRIVADGAPADLRRALGPAVVRVHPASARADDLASLLRTHSPATEIDVLTDPSGAPMLRSRTGREDPITAVLPHLARAGVAFEYGPPTLGDVYLAHTGEGLDAPPPMLPPLRTRRRRSGGPS